MKYHLKTDKYVPLNLKEKSIFFEYKNKYFFDMQFNIFFFLFEVRLNITVKKINMLNVKKSTLYLYGNHLKSMLCIKLN